jgi:hypothetical protein
MVVPSSGSAEFDGATKYGQNVRRVHVGDQIGVRVHGLRVAAGAFHRVAS